MKILNNKKVQLIGAPISIASPAIGASLGPDAIRLSGLKESFTRLGIKFDDIGNLPSLEEPFPPRNFNHGEIRYLDEVYDFMTLLKDKVYSSLVNSFVPVILGGDHSLALGSLSASIKYHKENNKDLGLIWFDAHGDFNTEETSPSGNIHGMPLAIATGQGNDKLLSLFENNFINPKKVVLIGVRSIDPEEGKRLDEYGINVITMKDIDENGMLNSARKAIEIATANNSPLHLSFDVDGLDAHVIPGTGTPVLGGVTLRESHLLLELIAETGLLASMDLVEVNPLLDYKNQTANVARTLLESALGKVIY
ncbi:MAG: arginase [Candidatus Sericytochromatia bacterium]